MLDEEQIIAPQTWLPVRSSLARLSSCLPDSVGKRLWLPDFQDARLLHASWLRGTDLREIYPCMHGARLNYHELMCQNPEALASDTRKFFSCSVSFLERLAREHEEEGSAQAGSRASVALMWKARGFLPLHLEGNMRKVMGGVKARETVWLSIETPMLLSEGGSGDFFWLNCASRREFLALYPLALGAAQRSAMVSLTLPGPLPALFGHEAVRRTLPVRLARGRTYRAGSWVLLG